MRWTGAEGSTCSARRWSQLTFGSACTGIPPATPCRSAAPHGAGRLPDGASPGSSTTRAATLVSPASSPSMDSSPWPSPMEPPPRLTAMVARASRGDPRQPRNLRLLRTGGADHTPKDRSSRTGDQSPPERHEDLVVLLVDTEHPPRVRALYESWGFRQVGVRQPFADSPLYAVMLAELPLRFVAKRSCSAAAPSHGSTGETARRCNPRRRHQDQSHPQPQHDHAAAVRRVGPPVRAVPEGVAPLWSAAVGSQAGRARMVTGCVLGEPV